MTIEELIPLLDEKIKDLNRGIERCPVKWMSRNELNRMRGEIKALTNVKTILTSEETFSSGLPYFVLETVWR